MTDLDDLFDRDYLAQNFSQFPELFRELLQVYIPDAQLLSMELAVACHAVDFSSAALIVHKLKGASASVGAVRVRKMAEKIEERLVAGDMSGVVELLGALQAEIDEVTRDSRRFWISI